MKIPLRRWFVVLVNALLFCLLPVLVLASATLRAAPVLRSISEVLALTPEEADEGRPVHLSAIVTFPLRDETCMVQDEVAGIYMRFETADPTAAAARLGDRVDIEGITAAGQFRSVITYPPGGAIKMRILGHGEPPPARRITPDELLAPELDCRWVEIEAVVHSVMTNWWRGGLLLEIGGQLCPANVARPPLGDAHPPLWFAGKLRIRAVASVRFNHRRQMTGRTFLVPQVDCIEPLDSASEEELYAMPLTPISTLFRIDSAGQRHRVRLRGVVTHAEAGRAIFLQSGEDAVRAGVAQTEPVKAGDVVDIVGWPDLGDFKPELRTAIYRRVAGGMPPVPARVTIESILTGAHEARLVSLDAEWIEQHQTPDGWRIILRTHGTLFEARLPGNAPSAVALPFPHGSTVRVSGICQGVPTSDYRLPIAARTFALLLRNASDIRLIVAPPWWTPQRLLWLLGGAISLAGLALGWAVALRHRVNQQTQIIGEQIARQSTLDERQRIARELHDTLEQELAGVGLQLETASRRLSDQPEEAQRSLEIARRMLRHSREESRSSIRDLRSLALEKLGLLGAVEELTRPLVESAGVRLEINGDAGAEQLPPLHANHLVRIAHEAVANAVRHGSSTLIEVRFALGEGGLRLEIKDDGCGFNPEATGDETDHFGLLGMQERTRKMRGTFHVQSRQGSGTRVIVTVPFDAPPPPPIS